LYSEGLLYRQSELLLVTVLLGVLLLVTELGFRRGRAARTGMDERSKAYNSNLQTGAMGLLALLLAFAFSMSATRYETRKQLLVDETNAIGTAWLRARMLAQPFQGAISRLMRDYTSARLNDYQVAILNDETLAAAENGLQRVQNELWSQTTGVSAQDPRPVPTGLFIQALNSAFDAASKRDAARENHVPQPVLYFLFVVTILTMALLGFGCGLGDHRNLPATMALCVLVSLVILVIMDLDRPRRGLIEIDQKPMVQLLDAMRR
jgi:hypothetical protein